MGSQEQCESQASHPAIPTDEVLRIAIDLSRMNAENQTEERTIGHQNERLLSPPKTASLGKISRTGKNPRQAERVEIHTQPTKSTPWGAEDDRRSLRRIEGGKDENTVYMCIFKTLPDIASIAYGEMSCFLRVSPGISRKSDLYTWGEI